MPLSRVSAMVPNAQQPMPTGDGPRRLKVGLLVSSLNVTPENYDLASWAANSPWIDASVILMGIPAAVAIHLGLQALGVKPGDSVICPTLTFGATAFAIVHAGARPVFLDAEEESWNIDPALLSEVRAWRRKA